MKSRGLILANLPSLPDKFELAPAIRQQYNFSPPDSCREVEEYNVNLAGVTTLELGIIPDISGEDVRASLARLLLA